jgi:hypothetical protein
MRISSITPMKNEAPFLLEWVAYHRLIGINDILVFSNDCTDGTDQMLERLDEMGMLRHYPNPSMINGSGKHHLQLIRYINTSDRLRRSDWVVSLDVDEFICVNAGAGRLEDLFKACDHGNVILMSQHNFGCGGIDRYDDDLLIAQFQQASTYDGQYLPHRNGRGVKTLTHQSAQALEHHNHSPIFRPGGLGRVFPVNGSGTRLHGLDMTRPVKSLDHPHYGFDLVQLNHYAIRSMETFLLKAARGNANHPEAAYESGYLAKYDQNSLHDTRIERWVERVAAERDHLLEDPELRSLHDAAVAGAKARIAELKIDPLFRPLHVQLRRSHRRARLAAQAAQAAEAAQAAGDSSAASSDAGLHSATQASLPS